MEQELFEIAGDILEHPRFLELRHSRHHGKNNNLYDHCIRTARCALRLCHSFELSKHDTEMIVRAALLHDFFEYNWRDDSFYRFRHSGTKVQRLSRMHAFYHGKRAAARASELFELNARQLEAIERHMFPLAKMPMHKEGWIITLADKVAALGDMAIPLGHRLTARCRMTLGLEH
ncbi:MAG: HD domain-containing protein [Butyricicoccaceae bacterium]